jgi:hypothetical protein
MENLPHPKELSKQVWLIPCKISSNSQIFIPLLTPLQTESIGELKKNKWKIEEEEYLKDMASKSKRWSAIAKEININFHRSLKVRDGKQCRERWINHLNPMLNKEKWTIQEDSLILDTWRQLGPKWAQIAKLLQNRTENQVKNRIKSLKVKPEGDLSSSGTLINSKLETIEPFMQTESESLSPMMSFKIEEMKSVAGSMSSILEDYFNQSHSEQYLNAQRLLDGLVSNK